MLMSLSEHVFQLGLPSDFPEFFPPQLEQYRHSIAEGADAPDEYAVAYMLAAAATAVGADVSACVQPGWCVRANLFLAVMGYKGSGKSTLAERCFGPLVQHEDELRHPAAASRVEDDGCYDDEGDTADDSDGGPEEGGQQYLFGRPGRRKTPKKVNPCVVVNDCTGPALLQLLDQNRRQLLVNTDELSGQFARGGGGAADRAMWCELYDGRRRRRARASAKAGSATLEAPYVNLIGGIQPELFSAFYNRRGDDGLLDRILLVGDGKMHQAGWPRDADDPSLNAEWSRVLSRLLRIEVEASDAIGHQVESRFTPAAVDVCRGLLDRLNNLVVVLGVPGAQRGVVKKLVQHAVKLALLHRALRWAAGEFGDHGPLGDVDADDAAAASEATLFFLGRWILWRPELLDRVKTPTGPISLVESPGDDPVLQSLSRQAADAKRGVSVIERLIRLLRSRGPAAAVGPAELATTELFHDVTVADLQAACSWLVDQEYAEWDLVQPGVITLSPVGQIEQQEGHRSLVASGDA
jgi:energy-coupling factor transporter ATP-binding protein EcfA2